MKRIVSVLLVLLLVTVQSGYAIADLFSSQPTWVEGCLCLSGRSEESEESSSYRNWKVWFIDFNRAMVSATEIPTNATLIKDSQENCLPTIVYPSEVGGMDGWYSHRSLDYAMLDTDPSSDSYREFLPGYPEPMHAMDSPINSEALFRFLALKMPEEFMYLLEYGVGMDGELCIQLKKRTIANDYVIQEFPVSRYDFSAWSYSVSESGRIAWSCNKETIHVGDENGVEELPDTECPATALAWLNEDQLVYFQNTFQPVVNDGIPWIDYNCKLVIWDMQSGTRSELVDQQGNPVTLYGYIKSIAVHEN